MTVHARTDGCAAPHRLVAAAASEKARRAAVRCPCAASTRPRTMLATMRVATAVPPPASKSVESACAQ
jgi:hypothetical protein